MDHMRQDQMYTAAEMRRNVVWLVWVGMDHRNTIEAPSGTIRGRWSAMVS